MNRRRAQRAASAADGRHHVVFLCHANVARSASAELLARHLVGTSDAWRFSSAGTHALVGRGVDRVLADALRARGIATSPHRARQADESTLARPDIILAFESRHRDWVAEHHPRLLRNTTTIRRAARLLASAPLADPRAVITTDDAPFSLADDFDDPIGQGSAAAHEAIDEIEELLRVILPSWGGFPGSMLAERAAPMPTRRWHREQVLRA